MSTKIYNGFRFKDCTTLDQVLPVVMSLRKILRRFANVEYNKILAENIALLIDEPLLKNEKPLDGAEAYTQSYRNIQDRMYDIKKTSRRDPLVDFDVSINIYLHATGVYGIYYIDHRELASNFREQYFFEDFSWWNNTDPDEDCNEEQWEFRGDVWGEILFGYAGSNMYGLTADIVDPLLVGTPIAIENFVEHIPTKEERATKLAKTFLRDERVDKDAKTPSQIVRSLSDVRDWMETEEGKEVLDEKINYFISQLPEINREYLSKKT